MFESCFISLNWETYIQNLLWPYNILSVNDHELLNIVKNIQFSGNIKHYVIKEIMWQYFESTV